MMKMMRTTRMMINSIDVVDEQELQWNLRRALQHRLVMVLRSAAVLPANSNNTPTRGQQPICHGADIRYGYTETDQDLAQESAHDTDEDGHVDDQQRSVQELLLNTPLGSSIGPSMLDVASRLRGQGREWAVEVPELTQKHPTLYASTWPEDNEPT